MSVRYEISCPYHGKPETLEVPDSYGEYGFEGEVQCGGGAYDRLPLDIKIATHRATTGPNSPVIAQLVSVERGLILAQTG